MKTRKTMFGITCGMDAAVKKACDNGDEETPEQPQARTAEKIEFGTDLYTNVSCEKPLLNAEWTAVKTKLTTALDDTSRGTYGSALASWLDGNLGINIDLLETTTGYSYYKLDGGTKKILFNADYVIGASVADLSVKITNGLTGTEQQ